jgi:hypothetical protein
MPELTLRFKKKWKGQATLTCARKDGTVTGQRSGGFFVWHDLEHYAIETTLGLRSAFYGMLARGWDLDDFGTPWPLGPFPPDAAPDLALGEHLAGMLDLERVGTVYTLEELNAWLRQAFETAGLVLERPITEEELTRIRAAYRELAARWIALSPGETLELPFPAEPPASRAG